MKVTNRAGKGYDVMAEIPLDRALHMEMTGRILRSERPSDAMLRTLRGAVCLLLEELESAVAPHCIDARLRRHVRIIVADASWRISPARCRCPLMIHNAARLVDDLYRALDRVNGTKGMSTTPR